MKYAQKTLLLSSNNDHASISSSTNIQISQNNKIRDVRLDIHPLLLVMCDGAFDSHDTCAGECRSRFIQCIAEDIVQSNFPEMPEISLLNHSAHARDTPFNHSITLEQCWTRSRLIFRLFHKDNLAFFLDSRCHASQSWIMNLSQSQIILFLLFRSLSLIPISHSCINRSPVVFGFGFQRLFSFYQSSIVVYKFSLSNIVLFYF